ncbi:MAG: tRNA (N6-isopentenyl adenosine(37)-C2)-methylthiotransferase MiaB [Clostridia bacterium]|nr:tRNA (N6-isopentenyl adenosine(37)-C2)-methylthiotransferase MiaB [Clostridia bacterium]
MSKALNISDDEIRRQADYADRVRELLLNSFPSRKPLAFIHTYGCQGNVADSERIMGMLSQMGYSFTEELSEADFVLYNTCAVREHAEDRVFGNVGILKKYKEENRNLIISLCGCMMQQEHIRDKIYKSYPYVDLVFGTQAIHRLPELLYRTMSTSKRVVCAPDENGGIAENIPVYRDRTAKAWLPIMYGCDNFCTYCVVPYVRGRERSREPEDVIAEAKDIIKAGYKEITLLGQNVNSYGKGNKSDMNFAGLLREINKLDGDFKIRFMTSHPKDCTRELIDTIAECDKVSKHLHLPFQSGNDRVLKAMNRHYDREKYLSLISYAKQKIPDLSLTSDVIVGFPGETYEEFLDTLSLIREVEFTSLFTFIFSARKGTKAAEMPDPVSREEKGRWFKELIDLQESIAAKRTASMNGKTYTVLVEGEAKNKDGFLAGRTDSNIVVEFPKPDNAGSLIGTYRSVKITQALNWVLKGELIK